MAVSSSKPNAQTNDHDAQPLSKKQRAKSPGVRMIGGRIYDSKNGKTCHQCRQKTMDFMALCKNQEEKKQCPFRFCHTCLLSKYGEKAEEAAASDEWKCPKCRGICNCSFCMKKRGHRPTGVLVHTAKATGFLQSLKCCSLTALKIQLQEFVVTSPRCREKDGSDGGGDARVLSKPLQMNGSAKKTRNIKLKTIRKKDDCSMCEHNGDDGASIGKSRPKKPWISKEDSKIEGKIHKRSQYNKLDKTSVEPIKIEDNKAMVCSHANIRGCKTKHKPVKRSYRHVSNMLDIQCKDSHVEILLPQCTELNSVASTDMLAEDVGHALQFLEFCSAFGQVLDIKKGQLELLLRELLCRDKLKKKDPLVVWFHVQLLSMVQKNSENRELRNWIDEQSSNFIERERKNKGKCSASEENMKKRLQNVMAKALLMKNGAPLSISEYDDLVSKIKTEVAETLAEAAEPTDPKKINKALKLYPSQYLWMGERLQVPGDWVATLVAWIFCSKMLETMTQLHPRINGLPMMLSRRQQ